MHGIREPFDPLRRKGTVFDGVQVPFMCWGIYESWYSENLFTW